MRWLIPALLALGLVSGCKRSVVPGDEDAGSATVRTPPPLLRRTVPESPGTSSMPAIEGVSELGAEVDLFTNALCSGSPAVTFASDGAFREELEVAPNTLIELSAQATLPGRVTSICSNTLSYLYDTEGPAAPELLGTRPASPSPEARVALDGRAERGTRVELFLDADCAGDPLEVASEADGAFVVTVDVPRGETTFTARAYDPLGNPSPCSTPLVYTRILGVTPVFPPTGGLTELSRLRVRVLLDLPPESRVSFVGPAGSLPATYQPELDEWWATVPLLEGPQTLEVRVASDPEGVAAPLVELERAVLPRVPSAIAWDAAAGVALLGDGDRVLEVDLASGAVGLRVNASELFVSVLAVTAVGGTTYILGTGDDGLGRIASWDGSTLRERARLDERVRGGVTSPSNQAVLRVAAGGRELVGFASTAFRFDLGRDRLAPLAEEATTYLAYDDAGDRAVMLSGATLRILNLATGVTREVALPVDPRTFRVREIRWDGFNGRLIVHETNRRLSAVDVDDARIMPLLAAAPPLSILAVRADTGALVFASDFDLELFTLDPVTAESAPVRMSAAGRGEALANPRAGATSGERGFIGDGARLLEVALGSDGGARTVVASGGFDAAWESVVFAPESERFFAYDRQARLLAGTLSGAPLTVIAFGSTGPVSVRAGLATRRSPGSPGAELLDVQGRRPTVLARPLGDLVSPRLVASLEDDEDAVAIAHNPTSDAIGVLVRVPAPDPDDPRRIRTDTLLLVYPADGRDPSILANLGDAGVLGSRQLDLAWSDGLWVATDEGRLVGIDAGTGEILLEREFPGDAIQFTAPNTRGVGFAVVQRATGLVAYDQDSDDWVMIAR